MNQKWHRRIKSGQSHPLKGQLVDYKISNSVGGSLTMKARLQQTLEGYCKVTPLDPSVASMEFSFESVEYQLDAKGFVGVRCTSRYNQSKGN